MKIPNTTLIRSLLLPVLLFCVASFATLSGAMASDDTLDEVLERHLAAVTSEKVGVEYETLTARGVYTEKFDDTEIPFLIEQEGGKFRFVVIAPQGEFLYSLDTGKRAFQRDPENFQWMELDEIAAARDTRIVGGGLALTTKAFRKGLELGESDDPKKIVLNKEYANGDTAEMTLDAETMLLTRVVEYRKMGTSRLFVSRDYEDYRVVEGRTIPFVITESAMGGWRKFTLNEVTFDLELPEDAFALPEDLDGADAASTR